MQTISRDDGFSLTELLISTTVMLLVLGGAMTAFKNALTVNDSGTQLSDSNQNLRAGTNFLVRDLMQAGRLITIGGIPIPSGNGASAINRPSPPGLAYTFDNTNATTLPAIISGNALGPTIDNATTDMVTMLMIDPVLPFETLNNGQAKKVQDDGSYMTLGASSIWLTGDVANSISPIKAGDLVWFNSGGGAIQTVTSTDNSKVYFAANDWFNFNQRGAAQGTVMQLKVGPAFPDLMKVYRLIMLTYYVDAASTPGNPKLVRVHNNFAPQALAGIVEDLDVSYDLVDGVDNPTQVKSLPYTVNGLTYTSNQIRKVNLHVGVRSEILSQVHGDYIRNHLSTAISIRDLAFVSRYR